MNLNDCFGTTSTTFFLTNNEKIQHTVHKMVELSMGV